MSRIKSARVVKGARVENVTRVTGFKMCQGCQGLKGAKGAWVKSSEGLLRGRVLSRTHFRSSLSPEEAPSCSILRFPPVEADSVCTNAVAVALF